MKANEMLPTPSADVIFKPLPEGAVLFHSTDEVYFGLNSVGARIWELLPPACGTVEQLCEEVQKSYPDADRATIRGDVSGLLRELAAHGLVAAPSSGKSDAENVAAPAP